MPRYASRILSSLVSLVLLLVMVFFLSRLTGDPAALYLPIDATPEMIENFRELHGLNDPLLVQFGVVTIGDLTRGRFSGASRSDLSYPLYEFLDSLVPLQAWSAQWTKVQHTLLHSLDLPAEQQD